jgi:hypothetical protein
MELVVDDPGYIGYCDASKVGVGGVWLSGTRALSPIVWRVEWPEDIRNIVVSFDNPSATITNSDLEWRACFYIFSHRKQQPETWPTDWQRQQKDRYRSTTQHWEELLDEHHGQPADQPTTPAAGITKGPTVAVT